MVDRLRVVLVDDHELVRSGVRAEIGGRRAVAGPGERPDRPERPGDGPGTAPVIEIVGEAGDVGEAIDVICERRPDVVLLDVHLPGGDGPAVIAGVLARGVGTRYLALSVSDAADDVIAVIRAGARGYVTKAISGDELVAAIARVAEGDAVFSPRLAGFVLDAFAAELDGGGDPELDQLSAREQEVMRLLARGYAYKEIARRLTISIKTVETHASAVLRKLQLSSRSELTTWAARRRLI
jgi:DNA-binding NarL/FixJ family response regulator